jgi:hypothetical protein
MRSAICLYVAVLPLGMRLTSSSTAFWKLVIPSLSIAAFSLGTLRTLTLAGILLAPMQMHFIYLSISLYLFIS